MSEMQLRTRLHGAAVGYAAGMDSSVQILDHVGREAFPQEFTAGKGTGVAISPQPGDKVWIMHMMYTGMSLWQTPVHGNG